MSVNYRKSTFKKNACSHMKKKLVRMNNHVLTFEWRPQSLLASWSLGGPRRGATKSCPRLCPSLLQGRSPGWIRYKLDRAFRWIWTCLVTLRAFWWTRGTGRDVREPISEGTRRKRWQSMISGAGGKVAVSFRRVIEGKASLFLFYDSKSQIRKETVKKGTRRFSPTLHLKTARAR